MTIVELEPLSIMLKSYPPLDEKCLLIVLMTEKPIP